MLGDLPLRSAHRKVLRFLSPSENFLYVIVFLFGISAATAETIPIPRARPAGIFDNQSSIPQKEEVSPCQLRLAELASFKPLPPITGPGECTASDVVALDTVFLPDEQRVVFSPSVALRCPMAEAVTHWVRDDVAPIIATLGMSLRGLESVDSFECRGRNGIAGAKISEHGRANALDVRAFKLANLTVSELSVPALS